MATSDQLKKKKELNVKYLITGEGGLRLAHECTNYPNIIEADNSAIERAINLAKSFTGISLHRISGVSREEIIWHKPKVSKKNKNSNFSGYFNH